MNDVVEFCTKINKHPNWWGFGSYLFHQRDETYICIIFYKWSINIGFMHDDGDIDDWMDKDWEYWIKDYWG